MTTQLGFYINSSFCSGCKTCQIACKDKNDLENGIRWRRVYEVTGGDWIQKNNAWVPELISYNLSVSCNHCSDPKCVEACPTGAQHKRPDGIVAIDKTKCVGCGYCKWACPYDAPQLDAVAGVMTKCNLCYDNLEAGLPPACVAACPMRAIDFGEIEEIREKYSGITEIVPLPDPEITNPNIIINPHKDAKAATPENVAIANREEVK